ncbi:hypothetical protein KM043_001632 [Ampulex compressa]|nr:hypothetical protein KM043_001632 [Ampulex compressa]
MGKGQGKKSENVSDEKRHASEDRAGCREIQGEGRRSTKRTVVANKADETRVSRLLLSPSEGTTSIYRKMPTSPYVSRVNQIDAAQLDDEIYKVLRSRVKEITKYRSLGKLERWESEIDVALKFLVWNFSLRTGKSTFGQQLLNLHYVKIDRIKSVLYFVLTALPTYLREKLANNRLAAEDGTRQRLRSIVESCANVVKLLEFVNALIFLNRGIQPRIVEYLLGISSASVTTHKPRNIGYSYMTRELLWHGLMELFTMGLPLINLHAVKQTIRRLWSRKRAVQIRRPSPVMSLSTRCAYCADSPILPVHAGCEHVFCYYCLKAHFTAISTFQCPECDTELRAEELKVYVPDSQT